MSSSFLDLQNGFYNAFSQGLGYPLGPDNHFQIVQPSPPLLSGPPDDPNRYVWAYFNNIPPKSLTQNYIASGGNQYFANYNALLSALGAPTNNFDKDIGPACSKAWKRYLEQSVPISTSISKLPLIFRTWAYTHGFISVANVGASDLAKAILEPVSAAQFALMMYQGDPLADPPVAANPPDWNISYSRLVTALRLAPSRSFSVSGGTWNSNVSNSWTSGSNSGFFGLWGGSSYTSHHSQVFAGGSVSVNASFKNVLMISAVPGAWYNSAAIGLAYSHKTGAPWTPSSSINWSNQFDPNTGMLPRFAINLVVVNKMHVSVSSSAVFSAADQTAVQQNSGAGLWPFYSSSSSHGMNTSVTFDASGHMTTQIDSLDGVPVVVGMNVLPVDKYLGH